MNVHAQDRRFKRTPGAVDSRALGTFNPTQIFGCKLWLDASQIEGLNDGDPIALWSDMSGEGNNAVQGVGGKQPTYETNELNGLPVVRFDGSDDMLMAGMSAGTLTSLIFVIIPTPANPIGLFDTAHNQQNAMNNWDAGQFHWWSSNPRFNLGLAAGTPVLIEFLVTNNPIRNVKYYKNAALISSNDGAGAVAANWLDPMIGSMNNGWVWYIGDLVEHIVYSQILSDADRGSLESYLNSKYAIY